MADRRICAKDSESIRDVPGIASAEWGLDDMGLSPVGDSISGPMRKARAKGLAAGKAHKKFLNTVRPNTVTSLIEEGVIGSGSAEAAEIGRKYSKRPQPWWAVSDQLFG